MFFQNEFNPFETCYTQEVVIKLCSLCVFLTISSQYDFSFHQIELRLLFIFCVLKKNSLGDFWEE